MERIQDFDKEMKGKRVLVRVDFNVPVDSKGCPVDDNRIQQALPTIEYVLKRGALVLMSHLGRPEGRVVENLRMAHIGERLQELLKERGSHKVRVMDSWNFTKIKSEMKKQPGDVFLLENLRFKKEESRKTEKDSKKREDFAKKLASLADFYVNDAFATCHRDDTSVCYVPAHLPSAAGFLVQREVRELQAIMQDSGERLNIVLGGAKVTDKIEVIDNLYEAVHRFFIGGKMALAFFSAKGYGTGAAEIDEKDIVAAAEIMKKPDSDKKIELPADMVVADNDSKDSPYKRYAAGKIPTGKFPFDIGEDTILAWTPLIQRSSSFFWNGPLGKSEYSYARRGTEAIANAIINSGLKGVIGGGDTIAALKNKKFDEKRIFLSTGGGATLEYLSGKELPGLKALEKG